MRLIMSRKQKPLGVLNKYVLFQLNIRLELEEDEQAVVAHYKLGGELIYQKENISSISTAHRNVWGGIARNLTVSSMNFQLTAKNLLKGRLVKSRSISDILSIELAVMQGCKTFKELIEACPDFKGETIIDV